jgi:hypothetical protein
MTIATQPKTLLCDGFLPFQVAVQTASFDATGKRFEAIVQKLKNLKDFVRGEHAYGVCPEMMTSLIKQVDGVTDVVPEGAFSSIAIPLFMYRSLTGQPTKLFSVVGSGKMADAIAASMSDHGVELSAKVIKQGDSPIELSVRDEFGNQETIRLYPTSRNQYRQALKPSESELAAASGFVLTRFNSGRAIAMQRIAELGGLTSLRIAEPSRYVSLEDSLSLLPQANQVILSHRDKVLQKVFKHLQLDKSVAGTPKLRWSGRYDMAVQKLIRRLRDAAAGSALITLILEDEVVFSPPDSESLRYRAPQLYDKRSRAARLQGATAAAEMLRSQSPDRIESWSEACNWIMQAAYAGTEGRPTRYPDHHFEPSGNWQVSD